MKRIFPVIFILISLSLIGIIIIQLSWLKNMILLREEQVKQKVKDATEIVGIDLAQHKGNYTSSSNRIFPSDNFSLELMRPVTVGQRFSVSEIHDKLKSAFGAVEMEETSFEFGLATISARGMINPFFERQSKNFADFYDDSVRNYTHIYPLISPSGSAAENLTPDEILIVVVPDINNIALKILKLEYHHSNYFYHYHHCCILSYRYNHAAPKEMS